METRLINATPHAITVRTTAYDAVETDHAYNVDTTYPPCGIVPRVAVTSISDGDLNGVPVVRTQYGAVEGLPAAVEGVTLIVSGLVLAALAGGRPDCVAPDTSPASAIRGDNGQIVAVRKWTR
jgi:hypothetical protein